MEYSIFSILHNYFNFDEKINITQSINQQTNQSIISRSVSQAIGQSVDTVNQYLIAFGIHKEMSLFWP